MATLTINRFRVSGTVSRTLKDLAAPVSKATITIDRTVSGGLNSIALTDTLNIALDYSLDDGATWRSVVNIDALGGSRINAKTGLPIPTEELFFFTINELLPAGITVRATLTASTPVFIAGSIVTEN